MAPLRIGILGTAKIARSFVEGVRGDLAPQRRGSPSAVV
jgi:hypothetical protein